MPHIDWAIEAKPYGIKFLIQAVYYVLPSPSTHLFFCLGKVDSVWSIFSAAVQKPWVRGAAFGATNTICSGISLCKHFCPEKKSTAFVRASQKPTAADWTTSTGLLATTQDLELKVDLANQLKFWGTIAIAARPDMVLISEISKHILISELTVPWSLPKIFLRPPK